jgi:hypothetical protein
LVPVNSFVAIESDPSPFEPRWIGSIIARRMSAATPTLAAVSNAFEAVRRR